MTKAQHTPGPWRIVEQTRIEADDYGLLASLRGEVSPHYETVTDANARLIAAAPELLQESQHNCRQMVEASNLLEQLGYENMAIALRVRQKATSTVIAKATGQAA